MVSQAIKYSSILAPIAAAWLAVVLDLIPVWRITTPTKQFVLLLPIFALFAFGIYCLVSLYLQVCRFKDRPDEAEKLKQEVEEAKVELRRKGVSID